MIRFYGVFPFAPIHISDQTVYKRLETEGDAPPSPTSAACCKSGCGAALAPFASEVLALDAMTVDQVRRTLPHPRGLSDGGDALIPGKIAARQGSSGPRAVYRWPRPRSRRSFTERLLQT